VRPRCAAAERSSILNGRPDARGSRWSGVRCGSGWRSSWRRSSTRGEWLLSVPAGDALGDAALGGFVSLLILGWWRG
jgi:hypothetical protein